jgi:hypothetical protein
MPVLLVKNLAGDLIVAVCENVGFYDYRFTYNTLNGESPAVNLGQNSSNYDALSSLDR